MNFHVAWFEVECYMSHQTLLVDDENPTSTSLSSFCNGFFDLTWLFSRPSRCRYSLWRKARASDRSLHVSMTIDQTTDSKEQTHTHT